MAHGLRDYRADSPEVHALNHESRLRTPGNGSFRRGAPLLDDHCRFRHLPSPDGMDPGRRPEIHERGGAHDGAPARSPGPAGRTPTAVQPTRSMLTTACV